ncbi:hypothetical protein HYY75_03520 [bacterium]|nr:hypothetical protein [bacterium]
MDTPRIIVVFMVALMMMFSLAVLHKYSQSPVTSEGPTNQQSYVEIPRPSTFPQENENKLSDRKTQDSPPPPECFESPSKTEEIRRRNSFSSHAAERAKIDELVEALAK